MKAIKKTLYFDVATEAKVQKIQRKLKYKVTESHIARHAIHMTPFDKMVEELRAELAK